MWLHRHNRQPFRNASSGDEDTNTPSAEPGEGKSQEYFPSLWDVLRVRFLLQWKVTEGLPAELVDAIVDAAEYWPSSVTSMKEPTNRIIYQDRDQVLLKTVPLCYDRKSLERSPTTSRPLPHRTAHPCRKIVFHLSSHDQGRGPRRENMYESSWTWFDTEVVPKAHERNMYANGEEQDLLENEHGQTSRHFNPDDRLLLPRDNKLQVNGSRVSEVQNVEIIWHYLDKISPDSPLAYDIERTQGRGRSTLDGRAVRELEIGDSIALWARARFPQWSNHVSSAQIRVCWAV
ncbi:hypothetical protein N7462_008700 [Penicillium macrosclerotiorum]|uniref:uncharacterized protein n=1 Tax=Penicillium macrosclerotiorum TaxID=303699 RepID=UPI002547EF13|nr:uncharacterized protein N7462_008700 [Penicillium macrosclerotiorum]KAJ5675803.1 hypothetical protein N7462_008700 [Penicillium macrosclerotiorum]